MCRYHTGYDIIEYLLWIHMLIQDPLCHNLSKVGLATKDTSILDVRSSWSLRLDCGFVTGSSFVCFVAER